MEKKFNSTKHGILSRKVTILPGESRYGFRKLKLTKLAEYNPQTDVEAALVDYLIVSFWRMERALRLESRLISGIESRWNDLDKDEHIGKVKSSSYVDLDKLEQIRRYIRSIEKGMFRTREELERKKANKNSHRSI